MMSRDTYWNRQEGGSVKPDPAVVAADMRRAAVASGDPAVIDAVNGALAAEGMVPVFNIDRPYRARTAQYNRGEGA